MPEAGTAVGKEDHNYKMNFKVSYRGFRVPSLILLHPEEQLVNLNLQHYTVVDCEPLHDIKGHLLNLFQELPSVLPTEIKDKCEIRINLCLKNEKKSTAADL